MLSSRINPDVCLAEVSYFADAFQRIEPIKNTAALRKRLLAHCQTAEQKNAINNYLSKHIGHSTFFTRIFGGDGSQQEKMVRKYLSFVVAALDGKVAGLEVSGDKKSAMMSKLTEGIQHCNEGYLNRVYIVLGSLQQPQTINQLLAAYRLHLVEKAYQSHHVDEVHAHHRFFVLANEMGYAIPYEEVNDRYVGSVPDSQIKDSLKRVFNEWYVPKQIVKHIWEHAQLELLGYVGKREPSEGYTVGDYEGILNYFRKLFEKPDLAMTDCFVVDEESYAVTDINWRKIHSELIEYLEERHYFNAFENEKRFESKSNDHTLTYTCNPGAVREGLLVYKRRGREKQYQYGLDVESSMMDSLPASMQNKLNKWLSDVYIHHVDGETLLNAAHANDLDALVSALNVLTAGKCLRWVNDENGNNPLHAAVLSNNPEMISLLIQYGADITSKNNDDYTPIQLATRKNRWDCVEAFAKHAKDEDGKANFGDPLIMAVDANRLETVRLLLKAGAQTTWTRPETKNDLLHVAAEKSNPEMIALLIEHRVDLTSKNKDGYTPIQLATRKNRWDCVEAFARHAKDEGGKANFGDPLIVAVNANRLETVRLLLKAGAKTHWDFPDTENGLLHVASEKSNPEMIALLIEHGVNLTSKNKDGYTPIQLATRKKRWDCVEAFARHAKDEDGKANFGDPLIVAVHTNRLETVKLLLKAGAKTHWDFPDTNNTALHCAAENNNPDMITLLIEYGADPKKKNKKGRTPIELASSLGYGECVKAFNRKPEAAVVTASVIHPSSLWVKRDSNQQAGVAAVSRMRR